MRFGEIIKKAWHITWHYRWLWVLGVFAGITAGAAAGAVAAAAATARAGASRSARDGGSGRRTCPTCELHRPLLQQWLPFILVVTSLCCSSIGIAFAVIGIGARGGLVWAVNEIEDGRAPRLGEAWNAGFARFWSIFGLGLLLQAAARGRRPAARGHRPRADPRVRSLRGDDAQSRGSSSRPMCGVLAIGVPLLIVAARGARHHVHHRPALHHPQRHGRGARRRRELAGVSRAVRRPRAHVHHLAGPELRRRSGARDSDRDRRAGDRSFPAVVAAIGENWGTFAGMIAIFVVLVVVLSLAFTADLGHVHLGDVDDLLPPPDRPRSRSSRFPSPTRRRARAGVPAHAADAAAARGPPQPPQPPMRRASARAGRAAPRRRLRAAADRAACAARSPAAPTRARRRTRPMPEPGRLIVCATPIGNLGDVTLRVLDALRDGRRHRRRGHARDAQAARALRDRRRRSSATTSTPSSADAGARRAHARRRGASRSSPTRARRASAIPGARLVDACLDAGVAGRGAAGRLGDPRRARRERAAHARLLLRRLPAAGRPASAAARSRRSRALDATLVFYESPHRAAATLAALAEALPGRDAARWRASSRSCTRRSCAAPIEDVAAEIGARESLKGEVVLLVGPPPRARAASVDDADAGREHGRRARRGGRDAAARRSSAWPRSSGCPRSEVYEIAHRRERRTRARRSATAS